MNERSHYSAGVSCLWKTGNRGRRGRGVGGWWQLTELSLGGQPFIDGLFFRSSSVYLLLIFIFGSGMIIGDSVSWCGQTHMLA